MVATKMLDNGNGNGADTDLIYNKVRELYAAGKNDLWQIASMVVEPSDSLKTYFDVLNFFTHNGWTCVMVCVDRPHTYYAKMLSKHGIRNNQMYYIDMVTNVSVNDTNYATNLYNVEFVKSPSDLVGTSIACSKIFDEVGNKSNKSLLLFGGLTTMRMYNDSQSLGRFLHHMNSKIRTQDLYGVYILADDLGDKQLENMINSQCDINIDAMNKRPEAEFDIEQS